MAAQQPLHNLARPSAIGADTEKATRGFLQRINAEHAAAHPGHDVSHARIAAYELAGRMQLAAPEDADLSREPAHVRALYGTDSPDALKAAYARNCLLSRRFLERDVRYVSSTARRDLPSDPTIRWREKRSASGYGRRRLSPRAFALPS